MSTLPEREYSPEEIAQMQKKLEVLKAIQQYKKEHKRDFNPWDTSKAMTRDCWYPWQLESFDTFKQQWMTMAANQIGKTVSEGYHFALDATGQYPDWWRGYRYTHAPLLLALAVDAEQLRAVVQPELFGDIVEPEKGRKHFTGGWIHRDEIGRIEWSQVPNVAKRIEVFSKYGRSSIVLRTSSQSKTGSGSLSFAGSRICRIWVDECPPDELVGQLNVRTANGNLGKGGHIGYTMTPERGSTQLVTNFMEHRDESQLFIGPIAWDQAPHMTEEKKAVLLAGIPDHEIDMRSKGIPFFGEGLVYTCADSAITTSGFVEETGKPITSIPWLRYIRAMDLGISHPTAIVWMAYDPEIDRIYVLRTYSESGSAAALHAAAANSYLDFAPCVFPPDIDTREKGSGKTLRAYYEEAGLRNTINFQNEDGTKFVEPGIAELNDRMRTDRFKVVDTCQEFFREKRLYHRENGQIVKQNDDILDAVRYGSMMIRKHGVLMNQTRKHGRRPKVKRSMSA
jgi:hypothetical protein